MSDIDLETMKAFLETDEGKALIAPIVEAEKQPLLTRRDELLAEKAKWKDKWTAYEELGDVETVRQLVAKAKQAPEKVEADPDLLDTLRTQLQEKDASLSQLKTNLVSTRVESELTDAIAKNKGIAELLKPALASRIKAGFDESGNINIEVYTRDGKKMYRPDESNATIADLVAELRNDEAFGRAFEGSGTTGSGTRGNQQRNTTGGVITDRSDPNFDSVKYMEWYARTGGKA